MKTPTSQYDLLKRGLDIGLGGLLLVLSLPLQACVSLAVAIFLGRPILFRQTRPGKDERPFTLLKFRTMKNIDIAAGRVTNEQRSTRFGQFLRSTSLDELPSLWNVLRGDMSLVGPRPLRMAYLRRYSKEQSRRHEVRPGITGYAQVNGRNSLSWDDRIDLDVSYIEQRNIILDLSVLVKTISAVFKRTGVSAEGVANMTEFFGPFRTKNVYLVPLAEEHLATRTRWLNDFRIRDGISITFTPTIEGMREWFATILDDGSRTDWVGISPNTHQPVSMCGVKVTGRSAVLYIYVDPEHHGHGVGFDTMIVLLSHCRQAGIRELRLETPTSNVRALNMYKRLGFVEQECTSPHTDKKHMILDIESGHRNE